MTIALVAHLLAALIWVGGMFFAHMALRPAAMELDPPLRLKLMARSLGLFFNWVWLSIIVLLGTGLFLIGMMGGFGSMPLYIVLMFAIGVVMMIIFALIYFAPFRKLKNALESADIKSAGAAMNRIRFLVTINLGLGLLTVIIAKGLKAI